MAFFSQKNAGIHWQAASIPIFATTGVSRRSFGAMDGPDEMLVAKQPGRRITRRRLKAAHFLPLTFAPIRLRPHDFAVYKVIRGVAAFTFSSFSTY
jgi:hypothetical protein